MSHPNEGQDRLDYRETSDITEVHASVIREHAEPRAGSMPIPTWLGVLSAAALCWAGVYIGVFHGGFSGTVYNEYESSPAVFFPLKSGQQGTGPAAEEIPLLALGEKVYAQNCASCHQANGAGNPAGQIPPLAASEWVDGPEYGEKRLVAIILKGMKGPVTVKGAIYNGAMPAWGQTLKPRQVAAVATFIRQAWGNKGTGEFTEAQVNAAKKDKLISEQLDQWTAEQIKSIPVDETLPGGGAASPAVAGAPAATGGATPVPGSAPAAAAVAQNPPAGTQAAPTAAAQPGVVATQPAPGSAAANFDLAGSVSRGKPLYMQTCMACHQATGMGVPGAFPPLVGTEWVTGDIRRLIAITIKGITGAMTVDGKVYATGMPSPVLTYPQLKDDKNLADVLNYVRNSFGNKAAEPVIPENVAKVRAEVAADPAPFTEATLKAFK